MPKSELSSSKNLFLFLLPNSWSLGTQLSLSRNLERLCLNSHNSPKGLSISTASSLQALVISHLDYYNYLLIGISTLSISLLQSIL